MGQLGKSSNPSRSWIVLGDPGQGKSTMLRLIDLTYLAIQLHNSSYSDDRTKEICSGIDTKVIDSHEIQYSICFTFLDLFKSNTESIIKYILDIYNNSNIFPIEISEDDLAKWFNHDRWLIIIDSLDEFTIVKNVSSQ